MFRRHRSKAPRGSGRLGTMFVNEIGLPITAIELVGSAVVYWARIDGSVDLPEWTEVRVHGTDGSLVFVGPWHVGDYKALQAASSADVVHIRVPTTVTSVEGWPRV